MKVVKKNKRKKSANIRNRREDALHAAFVQVLLRSPLKDVKFSKNKRRISATFFGEKISYRIVVRRVKGIGNWSRKREEIYIDKQIATKNRLPHTASFKALCVHETVEKFLVEKYGLNVDNEAHVVAVKKEKQFLKRMGGYWKSHQMLVYRKWSKLGKQ